MINTSKTIAALILSISMYQLNAQDLNDSDSKSPQHENIVIHKKGLVKEKVTVVINGDDITINGKPVDEFKSNELDISTDDMPDMDFDVTDNGIPRPPSPPQVQMFRNDMMRKLKTNTAFLGVMSEKTEQGAKVTDVTKEAAAEKAGLKTGDIITKINDAAVSGPDDLYKIIGQHKPDDKVTITYIRNGKQQTAQAVLGKSDQMKVYSWNTPGSQFDMKGFNPHNFEFLWDNDKPRLGIEAQDTEDGKGVKITNVDDNEDSPAGKAGLKEKDIITQVNGKAISSVDDLKESVKDAKKGDTIKITYQRNNQTQTINVKFPKDLKTIDL